MEGSFFRLFVAFGPSAEERQPHHASHRGSLDERHRHVMMLPLLVALALTRASLSRTGYDAKNVPTDPAQHVTSTSAGGTRGARE
jgi:hypothetical protein